MSGIIDNVEIWRSAYRHGVEEADIRHTVRNPVKYVIANRGMLMLIGPASDARVLEIGLGEDGAVVHAMPARRKYWP